MENYSFFNRISIAKAGLFLAFSLMVFCACSSDDTSEEPTRKGGLHVSIPAVMVTGDTKAVTIDNNAEDPNKATTAFSQDDAVYVYNETTHSMDANKLHPNKSGKSVTLEGELAGSYTAGDKLRLFYNMSTPAGSTFSYSSGQTGESATVKDYAQATATVKAIVNKELETTSTAFFSNVQSIFRLAFSFVDWNGATIATAPTISSLVVGTQRTSLSTDYAPLTETYTPGSLTFTNVPNMSEFYFSAPFDESVTDQYDALNFTATATNGLVYTGKKSAPLSGFQNGCYYYSNDAILLSQATKTITVGVISYVINDIGSDNYKVHFWGGQNGQLDANCVYTSSTESKALGNDYWSNAEQTFYIYTAMVPADITGFKVHNGDRWFGEDANASTTSKAYIFNYGGDKALYE